MINIVAVIALLPIYGADAIDTHLTGQTLPATPSAPVVTALGAVARGGAHRRIVLRWIVSRWLIGGRRIVGRRVIHRIGGGVIRRITAGEGPLVGRVLIDRRDGIPLARGVSGARSLRRTGVRGAGHTNPDREKKKTSVFSHQQHPATATTTTTTATTASTRTNVRDGGMETDCRQDRMW